MNTTELEYVGFWPRAGASILDTILLTVCLAPVLHLIYGDAYWEGEDLVQGTADFVVSWVVPAILTLVLWAWKQATPGKMAIGAKVVDAVTGNAPTTGQLIGRYLGYFVALLPAGLGILWVAFDDRKQGWHDKLAGTVVVRPKNRRRPVSFD